MGTWEELFDIIERRCLRSFRKIIKKSRKFIEREWEVEEWYESFKEEFLLGKC